MKIFYIPVFCLTVFVLLMFVYPEQKMIASCENINFDDSSVNCVTIDTNNFSQNVWQIGKPQKTIFTSAMSQPNVIVTDTINAYPPSDTSRFIVSYIVGNSSIITMMKGNYWVNSDTLADFCTMELTPDNGITWIDVVNDTTYSNQIIWYSNKPVLTGNSGGWNYFLFEPSQLFYLFNVSIGDTVLWRFTFYSDSNQTGKDGIMFDDLQINSWVEGIDEEEYARFPSKAFPSPAIETLTISLPWQENVSFQLVIFNQSGAKIMDKYYTNYPIQLNIERLPAGIYYYEIFNESKKTFSAGRFNKK